MNPAVDLQRAFEPLIQRAQRRAQRIQQLSAQPPSPERDKALAAEQREIDLIRQVAASTSRVVDQVVAQAGRAVANASQALGRVQDAAEDAAHYEHLFHATLTHFGAYVPDPPDEQWPPVAATALRAMYRRQLLRTSPNTYAASFPAPSAWPRLSTPAP